MKVIERLDDPRASQITGGGHFIVDPTTQAIIAPSWFRTYEKARSYWGLHFKGDMTKAVIKPSACALSFMLNHHHRYVANATP